MIFELDCSWENKKLIANSEEEREHVEKTRCKERETGE